MSDKKDIDWNAVELEYRAGIKSLKAIGNEFGVSDAGILKRAKRDGWERDLSARRHQKVVLEVDELDRAGFVYVIYLDDSANERFYKIGMAATFGARFQSHQCSSPFDICVACAYYVGNMRQEERELHAHFANKRVRGEWFRLSNDDLELISKRSLLVRHG